MNEKMYRLLIGSNATVNNLSPLNGIINHNSNLRTPMWENDFRFDEGNEQSFWAQIASQWFKLLHSSLRDLVLRNMFYFFAEKSNVGIYSQTHYVRGNQKTVSGSNLSRFRQNWSDSFLQQRWRVSCCFLDAPYSNYFLLGGNDSREQCQTTRRRPEFPRHAPVNLNPVGRVRRNVCLSCLVYKLNRVHCD